MAERRRIIPASVGPLFKDLRENITKPALRLVLDLGETTEELCSEFAYPVLVKNAVVRTQISQPSITFYYSYVMNSPEQNLFKPSCYFSSNFAVFSHFFHTFKQAHTIQYELYYSVCDKTCENRLGICL